MPDTMRTRVTPLAVLAGGALGLTYLWNTDPHEPGHLLPRCPFRMLTGWSCPGCGATRMVYDLMHGDVGRAWRDNAVLLLVLPLLLWLLLRWLVASLRGQRYDVRLGPRGGVAVLAGGVAWMLVRNLA